MNVKAERQAFYHRIAGLNLAPLWEVLHALARYGANMLPVQGGSPHGRTSPPFNYPYARTREALAKLARVGDQVFAFGPRDVFVVPSRHWQALDADVECVLFNFYDRPVHDALGLLREERATTAAT